MLKGALFVVKVCIPMLKKHRKEVLSSKSLVHFLPGADLCRASLYISQMSPLAVLLCLKILLI